MWDLPFLHSYFFVIYDYIKIVDVNNHKCKKIKVHKGF